MKPNTDFKQRYELKLFETHIETQWIGTNHKYGISANPILDFRQDLVENESEALFHLYIKQDEVVSKGFIIRYGLA